MTYTFKLSRRLARLKTGTLSVAILFTLSCTDTTDANSPDLVLPSSVAINPNSTTVGPNQTVQFEALRTSSGEAIPLSALVWTASGGTVDSTGKYTAGDLGGTYQVIVEKSTKRYGVTLEYGVDTAVVTVAAIAQFVLSPASYVVPAGATVQFTAEGRSPDDAPVAVVPRFAATGGTISAAGAYTAGETAGDFSVIATDSASGKADTSAVSITPPSPTPPSPTPPSPTPPSPTPPSPTPPSPTLEDILINPTSVSLESGETTLFSVTGQMSDGSISAVSVTWSASGGSISSAGAYTAGQTAGTYRVIAAQSGATLADTAIITITAPTPLPPTASNCSRTIPVTTTSALVAALNGALPGDCIRAAAGTYAPGSPMLTRSGTASQPITLEGTGSNTVLTLGGNGGIYLRGSHWRIRKLRITDGFFGIQAEGSGYSELDSLEIDHTKQSAINLRYGTHHTVVRNSWIHDTGEGTARYGEAIYIGGYAAAGSAAIDEAADDNQVLDNRFGPNVRAEAIDIKRGSDRVIARGNTMDGTGTVYEYGHVLGLVAGAGQDLQFTDNVLVKGMPHGITIWQGSAVFRRNRISLQNVLNYPTSVGIYRSGGTVTVACDNVVTDIPAGGSAYNVPCTP